MGFSEIWVRIKSETDVNKFHDLAMLVGTTQQFVSRKKSKNEFPVEWAYKVGRRYNLLTEWILTGEGPKRLTEPIVLKRHRFAFFEDLENWLSEMVKKEPEREEWAKVCIYDALPAFREWKKKKEPNVMEEGDYPQDKVA